MRRNKFLKKMVERCKKIYIPVVEKYSEGYSAYNVYNGNKPRLKYYHPECYYEREER